LPPSLSDRVSQLSLTQLESLARPAKFLDSD
jgi:hypothetical protein